MGGGASSRLCVSTAAPGPRLWRLACGVVQHGIAVGLCGGGRSSAGDCVRAFAVVGLAWRGWTLTVGSCFHGSGVFCGCSV